MEVIAAIVGSFVTKVASYTISPIKNNVKYLSNPDNKVQSLKNEINNLNNARERVQHSVDVATRNGINIQPNVDMWLAIVNKKIDEDVQKVIKDHETQAKKKCFFVFCLNLWAHYKFNKNVEEEAKASAELLKQGNFDRVSYPVAQQDIIAFLIKGFQEFKSRTKILNGRMDALKDSNISIIGVHGMGGIGRTTLVKEVAKQVRESNLFDSMVLATITQTLDVKDIQSQIADSLGLKFEEHSIDGRASRLLERLKQEKVLVVLDDIWARLDLDQVGISSGDAHEGLKILLTSRDFNILSNGMDSQKNFSIGILTKEEAWDLFQKMAGECVRSHDLQPIAIEVAKKCARLPIAIATVARALKNKSSSEWKNALRELKKPSPRRFIRTTTAEVYSAILFELQISSK